MNEKDLNKILDEMFDYFGKLPNTEYEPKRFAYYVQLYKHIKSRT